MEPMVVDVRFYVRARNTQEAVASVMDYLPVLYPEPAVETEVEEYDLHSVNDRSVIVNGFTPPYPISFTEEGASDE